MNPVLDGLLQLADPAVLLYIGLGLVLGMLVGAFPGITATMAVALASSFTLTLPPTQGLAVLLTIYVASGFGDRVPAILINTPGTPASIATTFDGFPMAKAGKAGLALTSSAMVSAVGGITGVILLVFAAVPLASFALQFGPAELFALVVFGLTMMVGVSGGSIVKGLIAGAIGLLLGTIGRDPMTGEGRFTFGISELGDGLPFIAAVVGLFGITEILTQVLTHDPKIKTKVISQFGKWWPTRSDLRTMAKPTAIGSVVGAVVGVVPAAGGDIAGIVAWDQARRASKHPEKFGKGSLEGVSASDSSSAATQGGALTTTLALGIPGDSVMAVMLGSMIIWGIQPGPSLFVKNPTLIYTIAGIMLIAVLASLVLSLMRMRGVVKLLALPPQYLWAVVIVFCIVGTYAVNNSIFDVVLMTIFGFIGLAMRRFGMPPGPLVLGLILGPLAEGNLRRALLLDGPAEIFTSPIALTFLGISALALCWPIAQARLKAAQAKRNERNGMVSV